MGSRFEKPRVGLPEEMDSSLWMRRTRKREERVSIPVAKGNRASSLGSVSLPILASQWILPPPQEVP